MTCPHCLSDETELVHEHLWHCWDCNASWHEMAVHNIHYFNNGGVHKKENIMDDCVDAVTGVLIAT